MIVMRIAYATYDFILINTVAVSINNTNEPLTLAWYSLCVLLAYALRLGMEHKKNNLTGKVLLWQSICTISWCFLMVLVWNAFLNYKKGFEIYLFINSLFSAFMVGQLEEVFEMGMKKWIRVKLNKFLAEEKEINS